MSHTIKRFSSTETPSCPTQAYREVMRYFGSAVHIVTTDGDAGRRGVTVSACCSLSDSPPTVLFCLMRHNENNKKFSLNKKFCINTLAGHQQELADIFGGRKGLSQEERFNHGEWHKGETGSYILKDALISFDCELICTHQHATHHVFIGNVVNIYHQEAPQALMYLNRQYHTIPVK